MSSSQELHLRVKTLAPATYEVVVTPQTTVAELKNELVALSNVPAERQRLIHRGAVLRNEDALSQRGVEDGHVVHLVERLESQQNTAPGSREQQPNPPVTQQLNIGMLDVNGAFAAAGGINGLLQNLAGRIGTQQVQVVAHPPMGNQQGAAQVVQMMTVGGNIPNLSQPPHQLTALSTYLRRLEDPSRRDPQSLPPFSTVSRLGQSEGADAAFIEAARATSAAPGAAEEAGTASGDPLTVGTAAVSRLVRQASRNLQADALPALAAGANSLQSLADGHSRDTQSILDQARLVSSTAYDYGCLLLELSLAAANLAQAAGGNASPLICAHTGFLAPDGTHAHVTNRVPPPFPLAGAGVAPARPTGQGNPNAGPGQQASSGGAQGAASQGTPVQPAAGRMPGMPPQAPHRNMDTASPLAHAFFNAISDDDSRTRHMRMPVSLPNGTQLRLDLSRVVNAVESLILSTPANVLTPILAATRAGEEAGDAPGLRQLMTSPQTDEQRRHLYFALTHPILQSIFESLRTYFQTIYRVAAPQPNEEQPPVRPTRRAAARPVPSLTHPFASVPNPALEAMRGQEGARQGQQEGMQFNVPGGQVHVEMSIEGPLEIPVGDLLGMPRQGAAAALPPQAASQQAGSPAVNAAQQPDLVDPSPAIGQPSQTVPGSEPSATVAAAAAAPGEQRSGASHMQQGLTPTVQPQHAASSVRAAAEPNAPSGTAAALGPEQQPQNSQPESSGAAGNKGKGGLTALPSRKKPGATTDARPPKPPSEQAEAPGTSPSAAGRTDSAAGRTDSARGLGDGSQALPHRPRPGAASQQSRTAQGASTRSARPAAPGGGLAGMMDQMLGSPGLQQLLGSPAMQQMAQSPALGQLANSMLRPQAGGGGGGMPDLASMMQALVPGLAEAGQGPGQAPPPSAAAAGGVGANAPRQARQEPADGLPPDGHDFRELSSLPAREANRWREVLKKDRRAQQESGQSSNAASDAYRRAMLDPVSGNSGNSPLGFLGLD